MSGVLNALLGIGGVAGIINQSLPSGTNTGSTSVQFSNAGVYTYDVGTVNWVTPANSTIAAQYQLQVNVVAGGATGTMDTWLDLSTSRSYITATLGNNTLRVRIREKATGIVRADKNIVLQVNPS